MEKIHVTDNIEALDTVALKSVLDLKLKGDKLRTAAKNLLQKFNTTQHDEELAYIIGKRYLFILDIMFKTSDDKQYMELMYGKEYQKVSQSVENLKQSLQKRYQEMYAKDTKTIQKIMGKKTKPAKIIDTGTKFLTCKQLYEAIEENKLNMLLIDIRAKEDYDCSKIKYQNCINIPEDYISPGLSANTLGQKLPPDVQEYWDKRDNYDLIVLIDWLSTSENIFSTKLEMLRTFIVDWDFNRNYKRLPVYLAGGFREFLDTYPAMVTNAHTFLIHKNNELDELLEIDTVNYPASEAGAGEMSVHLGEPDGIADLMGSILEESDSEETSSSESPSPGEEEPNVLPQDVPQPPSVPEVPVGDAELKSSIEADRQRMLVEARLKKPSVPSIVPIMEPKPPKVNRGSKPMHLSQKHLGFVGLRNIRNTCYMNTIIQCLRVLPVIKHMFLAGVYKKFVSTKSPELILEFANLVIDMWSHDEGVLVPSEFYNKVCNLEKTYRKGDHEDCMEFFIFIFNKFNEDCIFNLERPDILTPTFEAKLSQLLGKSSIWVDLFFHEIRNQRHCSICNSSSYNFELDNTLMLSLPNHPSNVKDLIEDYFQEYSIPDYCCTKCKKPVRNRRKLVGAPFVLVLVLKRYGQYIIPGSQTCYKNENAVSFDTHINFGKSTFKLYSFAMHQGTLKVGHYTAGVFINNEWYEMNDEVITPMSIKTSSVQSKVCALFYLREDKTIVS